MNPADLPQFGPRVIAGGTEFTVWSTAERLWLCLFDGEREAGRVPMDSDWAGIHRTLVPNAGVDTRYGLRAVGPYDPAQGLWFDPHKLLLDPYATRIDRPFIYDPALGARQGEGGDTAALMPKGVVEALAAPLPHKPPCFTPGGLIYEVQVRGFTMRHPAIPPEQRGTIAALGHPAIIDHLKRLHVGAVELMPIHAWIDERHLPPLGLRNAWGYNPVSYFALDPRLCPGGIAELRATVAALHDAGIGTILDMVYNHNGESDMLGPTVSLRGLDARAYFRHAADGALINDTGTGNSIDCNHPLVRRMIRDSLRYFVTQAGVDGFRFDLAPALGRLPHGFAADAPLLCELRDDPVLADRIMIAEPWDIGPGGYQLGQFGAGWLEWNDRYRDDMRCFWRGDPHMLGRFATRLAGSSDIFGSGPVTRSVNFLAAHDGFTLADVTAYEQRHNEANGEDNRDGHGENHSWNNGVEGATADLAIADARRADIQAMLATLFLSRGTIMLTAGDEFGRSQQGNNNAYAQDNAIGWIDWDRRDDGIERHSFALAALRAAHPELRDQAFLSDRDIVWLRPDGWEMNVGDWDGAAIALMLRFRQSGLTLCINRTHHPIAFHMKSGATEVAPRSIHWME